MAFSCSYLDCVERFISEHGKNRHEEKCHDKNAPKRPETSQNHQKLMNSCLEIARPQVLKNQRPHPQFVQIQNPQILQGPQRIQIQNSKILSNQTAKFVQGKNSQILPKQRSQVLQIQNTKKMSNQGPELLYTQNHLNTQILPSQSVPFLQLNNQKISANGQKSVRVTYPSQRWWTG